MLIMDAKDWTFKDKPYDLRQRLFKFGCVITQLVQYLHTRGPVAIALSAQILKSGTFSRRKLRGVRRRFDPERCAG